MMHGLTMIGTDISGWCNFTNHIKLSPEIQFLGQETPKGHTTVGSSTLVAHLHTTAFPFEHQQAGSGWPPTFLLSSAPQFSVGFFPRQPTKPNNSCKGFHVKELA